MAANDTSAMRTHRRTIEAATAKTRLTTSAGTMMLAQSGRMFGSWSRRGGIDCKKNAMPKPAAERAIADSTRVRLNGLRTGRPRGGPGGSVVCRRVGAAPELTRALLMCVAAVGVEPRQD